MPTSTSGLAAAEEGECHIPLRLLFCISELNTEDGCDPAGVMQVSPKMTLLTLEDKGNIMSH